MDDTSENNRTGHEPASPPDSSASSTNQVADRIEDIPAADGAQVMKNLTTEQAADVAEYLDPTTAGAILSRMDSDRAAEIITEMPAPEASMVLEAMDPDDRVDVFEHVSASAREQLLEEMRPAEAAEVRNLEQYPPDSAGGIMTTDVTALPEDLTAEQAVSELRRINEEQEQMFYVYVVDRRKHLIGVLSMRDLILAKPAKTLAQIMRQNVATVPATMDQEEVARLMRKYKYLAMPVVDAKNKLLGIITVDDVVEVISQEAQEDVQKMFGAGAEERLNSPWHFSFRKRVGWLVVNLFTAFMAAAVVSIFQTTISALPILAAYQTIVSGMGGNAGAQAMAVAIRGIALGEVDYKLLRHILKRELFVGITTGLVIGVLTWSVAALTHWHENGFRVGMVIFIALMFNHINACVTGVAIPFVMKRLGFDPAQSATIFATTFTDCGGFFATLGLAALLQRWLV